MEILDRILEKIHRWLNGPEAPHGVCLACGRRYRPHASRRRGEIPGFCSATCAEHDRWAKEAR
jgi:hypothetical protein